MRSEEVRRHRILELAIKKFTTLGIAQVTMDDIARGVGMGKGTLYKYFPSKEVLLLETIDYFAALVERSIEAVINDESILPVEKMGIFLKAVAEKLTSINPATLEYMERFMPEAFDKIEKTRERIIMKNLVRLFEDGKKTGLFDPQMDELLVTHILIGAMNHIIDTKVLSSLNYSFDKLFAQVTTTLLKGCLTEEGRKVAFGKVNTER